MLRESLITQDDINLDNVVLSHYRLSEIRRQDLKLCEESEGFEFTPGQGFGTAKAKDIKEEFISQIIQKFISMRSVSVATFGWKASAASPSNNRLNDLFITDELTDKDLVNYAYTIRDKVYENKQVMMQIANNSPEQAMLGDFVRAVDDAVMDSNKAHQNQMIQLLSDPLKAADFARVVFDLLNIKTENESLHNS